MSLPLGVACMHVTRENSTHHTHTNAPGLRTVMFPILTRPDASWVWPWIFIITCLCCKYRKNKTSITTDSTILHHFLFLPVLLYRGTCGAHCSLTGLDSGDHFELMWCLDKGSETMPKKVQINFVELGFVGVGLTAVTGSVMCHQYHSILLPD